MEEEAEGQASAPKPKTKMVNVYNASRKQSFYLGGGRKIPPGCGGKIPLPVWNKVKDTISWLKRAERGDVI